MKIEKSQIQWTSGEPGRFLQVQVLENFLPFRQYAWLPTPPPEDLPPTEVYLIISDIGTHLVSIETLREVWRAPFETRVLNIPQSYEDFSWGSEYSVDHNQTLPTPQTPTPTPVKSPLYAYRNSGPSELPVIVQTGLSCLRVGNWLFDFQTGTSISVANRFDAEDAGTTGYSVFQVDRPSGQLLHPSDETYDIGLPTFFYLPGEAIEEVVLNTTGHSLVKDFRAATPEWALGETYWTLPFSEENPSLSGVLQTFDSKKEFSLHFGGRYRGARAEPIVSVLRFGTNYLEDRKDPDAYQRAAPILTLETQVFPTLGEDEDYLYLHTHREVLRIHRRTRVPEILNYTFGSTPALDAPAQGTLPIGVIQSLLVSGEYLVITINQTPNAVTTGETNLAAQANVTIIMDKLAKNILWYRSSRTRGWGTSSQPLPLGTTINPGLSPSPPPDTGV